MISLINKPEYRPGSLWFVIPDNLQTYVVRWIKSKLHEVSRMDDRKSYRTYITKTALEEKYSRPIHAQSHGSYFDFYALYGEWRVGTRSGGHTEMLKAEILCSIEEYADVAKAIDTSQLVED